MRVLYSFKGGKDGKSPYGNLIDVKGTLYGTTTGGGSSGSGACDCGAVFAITPAGKERLLVGFNNTNGNQPEAGLTNVKGTLYGTTLLGGANGLGTVFSVTRSGAEKVLYSFAGGTDGTDPAAGLLYVSGALYGTASSGGSGDGTVFKLSL